MLLLGKTQKKHRGVLPPTVPDLPLHPTKADGITCNRVQPEPINHTAGNFRN